MADTTSIKGSGRPLSPQGEAGAPEIEVTPEMVEAGASVLAGFDTTLAPCTEGIWAERVYRAMRRAALVPSSPALNKNRLSE